MTASASGLDPNISIVNARLQAVRVAQARGMNLDDVKRLLDSNTQPALAGFLSEPHVNVLELNLALDGVDIAGSTDTG